MSTNLKYIFSQATLSCLLVVLLMIASAQAQQVILAWDEPSTNEDGSDLTDLTGYIVYYGTSPDNYLQGYDVGDVLTYTLDDLVVGQTYYFAVTAHDAAGNESRYSAEASMTVPYPANVLPVISAFDATPSSGTAPLPVTLSVTASDSDGTINTYEWDVDGDGTYDTTTDTNTLTYNYISAGVYNATVKITDDSGESVISDPAIITVVTNQRPIISSISKKRNSKLYYTFSTKAVDPDGQVATYKWDFNGDGRYEKTTTSYRTSYRYKYKGTYKIKVKVIDNEGKYYIGTYRTSIY